MIKLKDGTTIKDFHIQDCCESVCADFEALEDTTFNPDDITYETLEIDTNLDHGFIINGYFVPCYDIQNGYYSGNLELIITKPNGEKECIDISDNTKIDYNY